MMKSVYALASRAFTKTLALATLASTCAGAPFASAASFTFSQDGFDEGAIVTGSFVGVDSDSDGILSYFALGSASEIIDFSMSFSGNSLVEAFSFDFSNLDSFVFYLGDNLLGNDISTDLTSLDFEGIAAFDSNFLYITGQGPTFTNGGFIQSSTGLTETANAALVPDSGSAALLLTLGLAGILGVRKRTRASKSS